MESIKILGRKYAIARVQHISRDERVLGQINSIEQKITILDGLTPEHAQNVLLHATIHGILNGLGFHEEAGNETLVQSLATGLHQCIQDNPELFKAFK